MRFKGSGVKVGSTTTQKCDKCHMCKQLAHVRKCREQHRDAISLIEFYQDLGELVHSDIIETINRTAEQVEIAEADYRIAIQSVGRGTPAPCPWFARKCKSLPM